MDRIASKTARAPAESSHRGLLDLSVIIVNYNVREFLEQALRSIYRAGSGLSMEVFVVDNNSVDGSTGMVKSDFPDVHLIVNDDNVGFGRANNQAIRRASGRYLLILNPDTIVQEDTFTTLINFMEEHPDAGAVGCKILNPDGSFARESRRAFPTASVAFYRIVGLAKAFPRSRTFGRYNMTYLSEDREAEVDALSGSCMLVRHAALYYSREHYGREQAQHEIEPVIPPSTDESGAGLFDEDFFMYGEDLDWCFRIQRSGWKIYYTPETEIIHYKGESTKKGELRYVRLFYGAMLRFTEKHFKSRYSNVFAVLVRAGIVVRAAMSVVGGGIRRLALPLLDLTTVYIVALLTATAHAALLDARVSPLFFVAVAPAYALGAVTGIAALGGYGRRRRIRSVWGGILLGMLVVASVSFFVKNIAFSRIVTFMTFPLAATTISIFRLVSARQKDGARRMPHALLVGHCTEAARLQKMLARHPHPPFVLDGFVESSDRPPQQNGASPAKMPVALGRLSQLRDIVRLRQIDDVVFASAALSNRMIFRLIQRLRDLPVHFRILAEGRDHVIGKASVDDLSMVNLVEAEETLVHPRSPFARRAFEVIVSVAGTFLHPLISAVALLRGTDSYFARLAERTRKFPGVIVGERSLIGYDPGGRYIPPEEWGLKDGVFVVGDAVDLADAERDEIGAAYWFYVRNQSASLDWDIVMRTLRLLRHRW
jgi:hypothetical protein